MRNVGLRTSRLAASALVLVMALACFRQASGHRACVINTRASIFSKQYVCDNVAYADKLVRRSVAGLRNPVKVSAASSSYYAGASAGNATVTIQFQCSQSAKCDQARAAYRSVADLLARLLDLRAEITILAQFVSFCAVYKDCNSTQMRLGNAHPSAYWEIPSSVGADTNYMYPQALARQLTSDLPYSGYDIVASFNSDMNSNNSNVFWFPGDPPIQSGQYDFEYVVLHEMVHGLGFLTSLSTYLQTPTSLLRTSSIESNPASNDSSAATLPLITFGISYVNVSSGASPGAIMVAPTGNLPYIFDKFLMPVGSQQPLSASYPLLLSATEYGPPNSSVLPYAQFFKQFQSSAAFTLSQNIYKLMCTSGAVRFQMMDGFIPGISPTANLSMQDASNSIVIQTAYSPFVETSSVSHFDQNLYTSKWDFLMRAQATRGSSLSALSDDRFPIGPKTMAALSTLGYRLKMPIPANTGQSAHAAWWVGVLPMVMLLWLGYPVW